MDPWKELAAREECRDAARRWAELERKRMLMSSESSSRSEDERKTCCDALFVFSFAAKLIAWAAEIWRAMGRS
jgi:hypothetical protein